jgi:hypothetical protein
MPQSEIVLPPDSTGKSIWTQERTVSGPGTVQAQYVIPSSERVNSGVYLAHTGAHVVQASATNGTSTGFWWLYNTSSTVKVALRRVEYMTQHGSILVTATSPRIVVQRFTFTGTPAGTVIGGLPTDSGMAASTASLRSTQATSVVTLVTPIIFAFMPVVALTAVGAAAPGAADWVPSDESGEVILNQNQGIVCYQADAGTASDTRRFTTNIAWNEFTIP